MHLKKEIANINTTLSVMLGFLLMLVGLVSPWLFQKWMPSGSPNIYSDSTLFISGSLGIAAGLFFREYYRYLMSKLLGLDSVIIKEFGAKAMVKGYVIRWHAISITLAPFIDLTIIAFLLMVLINSWIIAVGAVTFLTVNLMLSARDIIAGFLIYRYASSKDFILFAQEGFQVWAAENSD